MRLGTLLEGLAARIHGDPETPIQEICYDSREVRPGSLFVALRGTLTDGHRFIGEAARAGAAAVLAERRNEALSIPTAVVADSRATLATVAARFLGNPARKLSLIGVTGTNGKTSTVRLLESILICAGRTTGSLGTISMRLPGTEEPATLTTPESLDLQRTLARMCAAGVGDVVLEVSSHSLSQGRVRGLRFAVAACTNLTQDHLDFHGDMEAYASAKAMLFGPDYLDGPAILNAEDPLTPRLTRIASDHGRPVTTFSRGPGSGGQIRTLEERIDLDGSKLRICVGDTEHDLTVPLPGEFQVENTLAAVATALALEVAWEHIREGVASCPAVPGRLERVAAGEPIVLVDYAHTPDALDRVLGSVRPLVRGRLICVFGCGGDRDRGKRAPMARAACRHSDHVIATSDNPRGEAPEAILRDLEAGLSGSCDVVPDRREAIQRAISLAGKLDVVIIAGKGHETCQIVGTERRPFDDRDEAREALRRHGTLR